MATFQVDISGVMTFQGFCHIEAQNVNEAQRKVKEKLLPALIRGKECRAARDLVAFTLSEAKTAHAHRVTEHHTDDLDDVQIRLFPSYLLKLEDDEGGA